MYPFPTGIPNNKILMIEAVPSMAERDKAELEQSPGTTVDVVTTLEEAVQKLEGQHGYTRIAIRGRIYPLAQGAKIISSGLNAQ